MTMKRTIIALTLAGAPRRCRRARDRAGARLAGSAEAEMVIRRSVRQI